MTLYELPVEVSDTDAAYAAGVIDGEGCISFVLRDRYKNKWISLSLRVQMAHHETIRWLPETFGVGKLHHTAKYQPHHRQQLLWQCSSRDTARVLGRTRPYMKTKREQADAAVELVELQDRSRRGRPFRLDRQLELLHRVQFLNSGRLRVAS